jgi:hypothetical protein
VEEDDPIDIAIGRTVFWEPLVNYNTRKITRHFVVMQIAVSYHEWMDLFEKKDHAAGKDSDQAGAKSP